MRLVMSLMVVTVVLLSGLVLMVKWTTVDLLIMRLLNVVELSTCREVQMVTVTIPSLSIHCLKTTLPVPTVVLLIGIKVLIMVL